MLAFDWGDVRPEVARRCFYQGDVAMATLRHFKPRIVSEEGSSCGVVVVLDVQVLVEVVVDTVLLVEVATSCRFRSWSAPSASLRFRSASSVSLRFRSASSTSLPFRAVSSSASLRRRSASSVTRPLSVGFKPHIVSEEGSHARIGGEAHEAVLDAPVPHPPVPCVCLLCFVSTHQNARTPERQNSTLVATSLSVVKLMKPYSMPPATPSPRGRCLASPLRGTKPRKGPREGPRKGDAMLAEVD